MTLPQIYKGFVFRDSSLFVSTGRNGQIVEFQLDDTSGLLTEKRKMTILGGDGKNAYVGSIRALKDGSLIAIDESEENQADSLLVIDEMGKVKSRITLGTNASDVVTSEDEKLAYVSDYGTGTLNEIDLSAQKLTRKCQVGVQPTSMVCARKKRLYVCNSGSDSVSVVDQDRCEVIHTVRTAMTGSAPIGSNPNSLALNASESRLYVTNSGNNCVAVIDLASERPVMKGFVPTGWYPVSCAISQNGWLFAGTGKGLKPSWNDLPTGKGTAVRVGQPEGKGYGPNRDRNVTFDYILSNLEGAIARIAEPTDLELAEHTKMSFECSPYRDSLLARAEGKPRNSVLPDSQNGVSPFKHVLYIIKENRTYDQVFGDLPQGNGDPDLVLFGRGITPNHHALAEQFVLLDNTYCDGDVSQDGWEWSTAANDSDWNIKASALSYGGRGNPPGTREEIRPSNGYIWEDAEKKGLTYFSYGAKTWRGLFSPTWKGNFSKEWNQARTDGVPDHLKADLFAKDLQAAEKSGKWPNFILMSLADDHTSGTAPGAHTPEAAVASNDIALGKVVEAVSKSRFWAETAIFVIEDDAQNGPDHVDAHRTVALVVSPYSRLKKVDNTMYTSSSVVRSIQLCLGLAPSSQYAAAAAPMFRCFAGSKNLDPYKYVTPKVDLNAKNSARSVMAAESAKLDFSDVDLADFGTLNRILWAHRKPGIPYPGTTSAFR
jgi:YVTN family beta-propeller protein